VATRRTAACSAASRADSRHRAVSSLTTTAAARNPASRSQLRESETESEYRGGTNKKAYAAALATAAATPNAVPHTMATGSTAKR
jgi:hypothetical protein